MTDVEFNAELHAARQELAVKTLHDVQVETARTWARRAWAAYSYAAETRPVPDECTRWLVDAREYAHEALEHAALTEDPEVLAFVQHLLRWGRSLAGVGS